MPDLYVGIYIMCTTSEYVEYTVKNNRLNISFFFDEEN